MGNTSPAAHRPSTSFSGSGFLPRFPVYPPKPSPPPKASARMINEFLQPKHQNSFNNRFTQSMDSLHTNINIRIPTYRIIDFKVHVSIHIGTDGSSLAFAYDDEVQLYNEWNAKTRQNVKKFKTYLLLDENNNIIASGVNAKQMYSNLSGSEKNKWKFVDINNKLLLLHNNNNTQPYEKDSMDIALQLTAINGTKCATRPLFVSILKELKHHAMEYVHKNTTKDIESTDIQWIIAVPSVWNQTARQQVKEWMIDAQLVDKHIRNQCRIVCESDCAALAIKELYHKDTDENELETEIKEDCDDNHDEEHINVTGLSIDPFNITLTDDMCHWQQHYGEKYIVVDTESGSVSITCHDINSGECLEEIYYRSLSVNDMFKVLVLRMFSEKLMTAFIDEYPNIYMEIIDSFESAKYSFWEKDGCKSHDVLLPFEFVQFLQLKYKDSNETLEDKLHEFVKGKSVERMFKLYKSKSVESEQNQQYLISLHDEILSMDVNIWRYMFDFGINKIITNVEGLMETESVENECKCIYLVGCLACSPYFQYRMMDAFESKEDFNVIVPDHPTWSTVLGAAYFGITKNAITARKCNASYGIRIYEGTAFGLQGANMFHTGYDSDKLQNCFHVMVHKHDLIQVNDKRRFTARCTAKVSTLEILKSDQKLPQFQNDGEKLGAFPIEYDQNGEVIVEFHFGETTFIVYTYRKEHESDKCVLKEIDY